MATNGAEISKQQSLDFYEREIKKRGGLPRIVLTMLLRTWAEAKAKGKQRTDQEAKRLKKQTHLSGRRRRPSAASRSCLSKHIAAVAIYDQVVNPDKSERHGRIPGPREAHKVLGWACDEKFVLKSLCLHCQRIYSTWVLNKTPRNEMKKRKLFWVYSLHQFRETLQNSLTAQRQSQLRN